jgi:hypothetical protein
LEVAPDEVSLCQMLGAKNRYHRAPPWAAYRINLSGPVCTKALNGAEEWDEEKERKTIQAGSELNGGLPIISTLNQIEQQPVQIPGPDQSYTITYFGRSSGVQ